MKPATAIDAQVTSMRMVDVVSRNRESRIDNSFTLHLETFCAYICPGPHEYQSHTCMIDKDCGEEENVECAKLSDAARHKVCRCVDGAFLDPKSGKCGKWTP